MTDNTDILVQLQFKAEADANRRGERDFAEGYAKQQTSFGKIACIIRVKGNYTGIGRPRYRIVGFEHNNKRISRSDLVILIEKADEL